MCHHYYDCITVVIGRITITIGGSSCDLSFNLDHTPTLPESGAREACEVLDVWLMIERCVKMRSKLLLQVFFPNNGCTVLIIMTIRIYWICLRTQ